MNPQILHIRERIEPLRQEIINHRIYSSISQLQDLRTFMEYHVYAVWDFMSLLKSLQNSLTCTRVPWFPTGSADTRFLINEIVVGEESDIDQEGIRKSHFELYLNAMEQGGADTSKINRFITALQKTQNFETAFLESNTPAEAQEFVTFTFDVINSGKSHLQAAIFTFGREDLIPGMFLSMVNDLHTHFPATISTFKYYLDRHIEVDGEHHSHLALEMTAALCGNKSSLWEEAEEATLQSLQKRLKLWDGALQQILLNKSKKPLALG